MRRPGLSIDTSVHEVKGRSPRVSRDPAEIIPHLFIGSLNAAKNAILLNELGVKGVINASKASYSLPKSIRRLDISVDDIPGADMASQFHSCCEFIDMHLQAGNSVLVHCRGGISRSATIVIAYLMKAGVKSSLREAYDHTCAKKPNIMPNTGFFRQLLAWEAEVLGAPSMTLREYYKLMLLDYGFGRAEVNEVVDAADSDDYHAIVDRLHARHGLFVEGAGGDGDRTAAGFPGGLCDGRAADGALGLRRRRLYEEEEEEAAIEEEASEETPETTPGSSMAPTPS